MADRPILFSAPMVRALLDGRKTQTRRLLKVRKGLTIADLGQGPESGVGSYLVAKREDCKEPRIKVGDRLWVREAIKPVDEPSGFAEGSHAGGLWPYYAADHSPVQGKGWNTSWRPIKVVPSIHMPKWASRLTLIVTDVRVQRVQDICDADAEAEGLEWMQAGWRCYLPEPKGQDMWTCPRESYRTLWSTINGTGSWDANPWVAAYSFVAHHSNIGSMPSAISKGEEHQKRCGGHAGKSIGINKGRWMVRGS